MIESVVGEDVKGVRLECIERVHYEQLRFILRICR